MGTSLLDQLVPHGVFHLTGQFVDANGEAHETIQLLDSSRRMVASVTFVEGTIDSVLIAKRLAPHREYFENLIVGTRRSQSFTMCRFGRCRGWHWDIAR